MGEMCKHQTNSFDEKCCGKNEKTMNYENSHRKKKYERIAGFLS